jgi:hypothetical protein
MITSLRDSSQYWYSVSLSIGLVWSESDAGLFC